MSNHYGEIIMRPELWAKLREFLPGAELITLEDIKKSPSALRFEDDAPDEKQDETEQTTNDE